MGPDPNNAKAQDAEETGQPPVEAQTVVVQGLGSTVEDAAKNAAENALIQVAGSFVQTETWAKDHSIITNGIKDQSKSISTTTQEYSKGSIRSFEVIGVQKENGIVYLTAKVGVRALEFKAFVASLAAGEVSVDLVNKADQASSVSVPNQVNKEQENKALSILYSSIALPLWRGEASTLVVGQPETFAQMKDKKEEFYDTRLGAIASIRRFSDHALVIPVTSKLKDEFLTNSKAVLNAVSSAQLSVAQLKRESSRGQVRKLL